MVTRLPKSQPPGIAPTTQDILRVWRSDRRIKASSAQCYLQWIGRLRRYCGELGLDEANQLTRDGAERFHAWYARTHKISAGPLGGVSSSMRSLRRVYEVMGLPVLPWQPAVQRQPPATPLLRDYATHLGQHRGNPEVTRPSRSSTTSASCSRTWTILASRGAG